MPGLNPYLVLKAHIGNSGYNNRVRATATGQTYASLEHHGTVQAL